MSTFFILETNKLLPYAIDDNSTGSNNKYPLREATIPEKKSNPNIHILLSEYNSFRISELLNRVYTNKIAINGQRISAGDILIKIGSSIVFVTKVVAKKNSINALDMILLILLSYYPFLIFTCIELLYSTFYKFIIT
ncbi:hypothetical protein [Fusibacter sp. JL216-2]|uniref:hypothetical protein n=1 Tax=Fusibacter sp. JL216-2 TaxID=3071453 RepID=UPI003D3318E0